jgi:hypothetical protein
MAPAWAAGAVALVVAVAVAVVAPGSARPGPHGAAAPARTGQTGQRTGQRTRQRLLPAWRAAPGSPSAPAGPAVAAGTGPGLSAAGSGLSAAGSGPTLASIVPDSAAPGQVVLVSGTGLVSPDGVVVVWFGSQPALTRCASSTSCSAVVPGGPGSSGPVPVTVATEAGRSNAVTFWYR